MKPLWSGERKREGEEPTRASIIWYQFGVEMSRVLPYLPGNISAGARARIPHNSPELDKYLRRQIKEFPYFTGDRFSSWCWYELKDELHEVSKLKEDRNG